MRDIEADYRAAYLDEHALCLRAGRTERAEEVAAILRDRFGVDVDEPAAPAPKRATPAARKPAAKRAAPRPKKTE
jgi:hypothetical protein